MRQRGTCEPGDPDGSPGFFCWWVAQPAERGSLKAEVAGSTPAPPACAECPVRSVRTQGALTLRKLELGSGSVSEYRNGARPPSEANQRWLVCCTTSASVRFVTTKENLVTFLLFATNTIASTTAGAPQLLTNHFQKSLLDLPSIHSFCSPAVPLGAFGTLLLSSRGRNDISRTTRGLTS